MKVAIVDYQIESLDKIVKRFNSLKLHFIEIFTYLNVSEMETSKIIFDLILLDMDMTEMDGIEYARRNRDKKIIFMSDNDKYIKKAFGPNVYGFIGKDDIEFEEIITQVLDEISNNKFIVLKLKKGIKKFMIKDIVYLQYLGNRNIGFVYRNTSYVTTGISLKNLEEILGREFIYIDRSTMVNSNHIIGMTKGNLLLDDIPTEFKISRRKRKDISSSIR